MQINLDSEPWTYYASFSLAYRAAVAPLYPGKPVGAFLAWTSGSNAVEILAETLDAALAAMIGRRNPSPLLPKHRSEDTEERRPGGGSTMPADFPRLLEALRAGRTSEAEQACAVALRRRPKDPALHHMAALIALTAGQFADASRWATSCLALRPDHVPALVIAGRAAWRLGDRAGAMAMCRRACALSPDRGEPAFLLCALLLEEADPQALALLDGLLRRFPTDSAGWNEIGLALHKAGKLEAALAAFSRAFGAAPSVSLGLRRGAVLKELGRLPAARDALNAAAALGSMPGHAWFTLGLICQDLGDLPAAKEAYSAAIEADPTLAEAMVNLGVVRQDMGDLEGAKTAYGCAIRTRPDTFGRIAQAMTSPPTGELWLDIEALRRSLVG